MGQMFLQRYLLIMSNIPFSKQLLQILRPFVNLGIGTSVLELELELI